MPLRRRHPDADAAAPAAPAAAAAAAADVAPAWTICSREVQVKTTINQHGFSAFSSEPGGRGGDFFC